MYPRELRTAVLSTIRDHGPLPLVDLARTVPLPTSQRALKHTVENCVRAGVLVKAGHEKRAHCHKWVALYDLPPTLDTTPATDAERESAGFLVLGDALSGWR